MKGTRLIIIKIYTSLKEIKLHSFSFQNVPLVISLILMCLLELKGTCREAVEDVEAVEGGGKAVQEKLFKDDIIHGK